MLNKEISKAVSTKFVPRSPSDRDYIAGYFINTYSNGTQEDSIVFDHTFTNKAVNEHLSKQEKVKQEVIEAPK